MHLHRLLEHTQLVVIHVHLLSSYALCRSLDNPSDENIELLGVAENLATEDLEFPIPPPPRQERR